MKIAIVTHNVVRGDGQGRVNYELVRYLLSSGHGVTLIADQVAPELVDQGAEWLPVRPGWENVDLLKVWRFERMADRVVEAHRRRFDVIMACGVVTSVPHTVNSVHFVHGTWLRSPFHASKVSRSLNGLYQKVFSTLNARWEINTFRRARVVIAVSHMVRDELVEVGVPNEKIRVVINGVDLSEYHPAETAREPLGLPSGVPLGLFVGDIRSPIKNLDSVLRALRAVDGAHLAVAGRVANSPYPDLARELGILHRVHFLDFRTDIADLMRACDFFVLPSRRDSCPLVLLEALASGLPAVTSVGVGTSSLVTKDCGFVLDDPHDVETLARHLQTLAFNPSLRAELSLGARAVAEQHSWNRMSEGYLQIFEQYAHRGNGRGGAVHSVRESIDSPT